GPRSVRNDFYRGLEYTRLVPGFKLEVAGSDHLCDHIVRIITRAARTGQRDSGTIFVSTRDGATKFRTGGGGAVGFGDRAAVGALPAGNADPRSASSLLIAARRGVRR